MIRGQIIFSIVGFMLWWGPTALAANDDQAKDQFLEGKKNYAAGRYASAIDAFQAAAKIRPSPILDFNIGRCHHNLGQIEEALTSYRRYLSAVKGASNHKQVQTWIEELEQKRGDVKDPYPVAEPARPPSSQPTTAPSKTEPRATAAPVHEALLPQTWADPKPNRRSAASAQGDKPPAHQPPRPAEGPLYKQWWFWAGCAGAALITTFIIYTAASSGSATPPAPQSNIRGLVVHF